MPQTPSVPTEIQRTRVREVLAQSNEAPVRVLYGPHGSGKTTALLQYAAQQRDAGVVSLPPHASQRQVEACLASIDGARLRIIDRADAASPAGRDALLASIEVNWTRGKRYLLCGSSRTKMGTLPLVVRGIATMLDPILLPFSATEILELAAAHGVAADETDAEQLRYDTDGWPVAVTWIVRDAARNGRSLRAEFTEWYELNAHLLLEFVALAHNNAESTEAFVLAGQSVGQPASQRILQLLDATGYPIVRAGAALRPYRVLMQSGENTPATERVEFADGRLVLKLLGRFSCTIANNAVAFDRRRDQTLLAYIALAPEASVTRAELLAAFWPDAPRTIASQGLRSSLCRLRRAVSAAGSCDARRYVSVGNSIALDLDWVTIDARSFKDHVELAKIEGAIGNRGAARDHYLEAERIYLGPLLASEALEPQLETSAIQYDALFKDVRAHLAAMFAHAGDEFEPVTDRDGGPLDHSATKFDDGPRPATTQYQTVRAHVGANP